MMEYVPFFSFPFLCSADRIAMGRLAGIAPDWLFSMADQGPVYSSHQVSLCLTVIQCESVEYLLATCLHIILLMFQFTVVSGVAEFVLGA